MPFCPSCNCTGKIFNKKYQLTEKCSDCDGEGIISENKLKFIEYYKQKKEIEKNISLLESDNGLIETFANSTSTQNNI